MYEAAETILNDIKDKDLLNKAFDQHSVGTSVIYSPGASHVLTGISAGADWALPWCGCGKHPCTADKAGDEVF